MAERNDWDKNRDREQEMDRERGGQRLDTQRNRESRGYDTNRWENEGGRYQGENAGRGNFPRYEDRSREYDRDWRGDDRDRERWEWMGGSRTSDFGQRGEWGNRGESSHRGEGSRGESGSRSDWGNQGDWGNQANWGSYGNRPGYEEHGRSTGSWSGGQRQMRENEGMQHNQLGGMSAGHSSGMWSSGAGGGYGSAYGGGMGSYSGGFSHGNEREEGRHAGRGPKNWRRSDDRIREDINERLTEHPHIDASEIEVQVKEGEVTLTGTVEDRRYKRMVEDLVEGVSGVKEVHNQLRTSSGSQSQGGEMAKTAGTGTATQNKKQ